jgi:hypothetical protein
MDYVRTNVCMYVSSIVSRELYVFQSKPHTQSCNICTRAVWKVRGLALLLQVGTLWRCSDGLFFEVPPLASDEFLTTLHPLLESVL